MTNTLPKYSQLCRVDVKGNGITRWETCMYEYINGMTATETVTKLRNHAARYIRICRNQQREYGSAIRQYRVKAGMPFKLVSN